MTPVATLGIDLAKNCFSVHGVDKCGSVVIRRTVSRNKLVELVMQLQPCLIGMEACSGAHEWARRFSSFGHTVKLMAAQFVVPYRKSGKNDGNDAEAICEAVTRPNMRFVPVKSVQQQADLGMHRVRQGFIEERTGTLNRLRGLLAEFGYVLPTGPEHIRRGVPGIIDRLPARVAACVRDLLEHAEHLAAKAREYEREIRLGNQDNELVRRAQTRPGIGAITASALVATIGNGRDFKNGR
jgi:transposase